MRPCLRKIRRAGLGSMACAAVCACILPASAAAGAVSSNWAGYVALPLTASGAGFSSISGTWREPSATCTAGRVGYSAVWVGLGGYRENAKALEQIGTDADCSRAGVAVYATWYELLPASPVAIPLKASPGDEMSASVTVRNNDVTLRIRDLTTGTRFSHSQRAPLLDSSSADWIVEAPSECFASHGCHTLQLADFGSVAFSSATATSRGHSGSIADPLWSMSELELRESAFDSALSTRSTSTGPQNDSSRGIIAATPSPLAPSAGAFSVTWREQHGANGEPQRPTLPGFSGGSPAS